MSAVGNCIGYDAEAAEWERKNNASEASALLSTRTKKLKKLQKKWKKLEKKLAKLKSQPSDPAADLLQLEQSDGEHAIASGALHEPSKPDIEGEVSSAAISEVGAVTTAAQSVAQVVVEKAKKNMK